MIKTPFQAAKEQFKEQVQQYQKRTEFVYGQTDTFITWLIGFSVTGLLLIISNLTTFSEQFNAPLKPLVVSLLAVIFFGICFRFISFLIMTWEKGLESYYTRLFMEDTIMPAEPKFDIYQATVNELVGRLQSDFGRDVSYALYLDEEKKVSELPVLRKLYLDNCADAKKSLEFSRRYIAEVEYDTHRIPKKINLEAFDTAIEEGYIAGYNSRLWSGFLLGCFVITLLSFLTVVLITGISLLTFK